METRPLHLLLIEDDPQDERQIRDALLKVSGPRMKLETAPDLETGFATLDERSVDLVLLDPSLPGCEGLTAISRTRSHAPEIPIVVLCGQDDEALAVQAVREGAQDCLAKGKTNGNLLVRAIRYAIERHRMQAALRILSLADELTGLYNRRGFMTLAEHQVKLAQRKNNGFYLIFADLDGMKAINDTYGHPQGDRALVETAHILNDTFRGSDIIARMGGDEFAIITIDSDHNSAEAIASRLQNRIDAFNATSQAPFRLSISVGVVHYDPREPRPIHDLLEEADRQMYAQKREKKRCRQ